jgi:3-deoxy-D-manno-octulosonate 8-phosphate phosphatase (KDO 8-P phosphatase)
MSYSLEIQLDDIDVLVLDFDGVLTNNLVYVDQNGQETVCCSRADGLAFDALKKMKKPVYILSTEMNGTVSARANKLKVEVFQGVFDKA